ncbi:MAG: GH3 auxin-responsive promoter family protein [Candidatus Atabeyarchaeum deiterrae]
MSDVLKMHEAENDLSILQPIVDPWYESIRNPKEAQEIVLSELSKEYGKTRYGKKHSASKIRNIEDFRASFPILNYKQLDPYLAAVRKGDNSSILPEPLVCWVMTRGSTGAAKVLPATRKHLEQILTCGARALVNYVRRRNDLDILTGNILNLNFPSAVHIVNTDGRRMTYGYSSGTYAKLNPALGNVSLIPRQEEIDAIGSGIRKGDWHRRFELVYAAALGKNVTATMGVTPVILSFAKYINRMHKQKPKQLWNPHALFCTSVRKIQFKYAPVLSEYFGHVPVVEIYSATEGVFAQQLDDLPYVTPNYDKYLFEVVTGKGTKMLHELRRGEWGRLIISSCMFPRYDIGDMIEAAGNNYFRVFGRRKVSTLLEHRLYRLFFRGFL